MGVCPFDRNAIKLPGDDQEYVHFKPEALPQYTGHVDVPLYSPAPRHKRACARLHHNKQTPQECTPISQHSFDDSKLNSNVVDLEHLPGSLVDE